MAYKILIYGFSSNPGGIESFLINYIKRFNHKKVKLDFINSGNKPLSYQKEILDSKIKVIPLILPSRIKHPIKRKNKIKRFFRKYAQFYDCIWLNLVDAVSSDLAKYANKYGIHKIIVHSHNSNVGFKGLIGEKIILENNIHKYELAKYATDYWACSNSAAKWMFPKSKLSKVKIINNAIDVKQYRYSFYNAQKIRKLEGITDDFVIGNVGRLVYQKNQSFALQIIKQLIPRIPNVKLILLGSGPDEAKLKEKAKELGISNYVMFLGFQNNVNEWYSAFDLFLFPSLFEGLSIASLEAQANGLPILANKDIMPENSIINNNVQLLSLKDSAEKWAQKIILMKKEREDYNKISNDFKKAGFNINYEASVLEKMIQK